jgi:hypothetical protein
VIHGLAARARRALRLLLALAIGACAAPPPRGDRLAALEQRVAAQRARSAGIEAALATLSSGSPVVPATSSSSVYYELVTFRTAREVEEAHAPQLRVHLAELLTEHGTPELEYRSTEGAHRFAPPWPGQEFPGVPVGVLFMAGEIAAPRFRGAEFDLRVSEAGSARLVTFHHELDGRLRAVSAASPPAGTDPEGPAPDALRARFGIGPVEGWDARERASLEGALALLLPAELARLRDLPFRRRGRGPTLSLAASQGRPCGHFELEEKQRSVTIYDCAFATDPHAFVGSLDEPRLPSVRVILHEIAHALAAASLTRALAEVTRSREESQVLVAEFNELGRSVPRDEVPRVQRLQQEIEGLQADLLRWHERLQGADHAHTAAVRAFLRVDGAARGFTPYARTSAVEAYAEAFALCRTDPEAGRRISPAVCDFFASDAYLASEERGDALEHPERGE